VVVFEGEVSAMHKLRFIISETLLESAFYGPFWRMVGRTEPRKWEWAENSLEPQVLQSVCDVVKDTGKDGHLDPFVGTGFNFWC